MKNLGIRLILLFIGLIVSIMFATYVYVIPIEARLSFSILIILNYGLFVSIVTELK